MRRGLARTLSLLAFVGVIAMAAAALTTNADARHKGPPVLLCGPTILYECTFRDGSKQLVGLTACEVERFEKKNKATCVPSIG